MLKGKITASYGKKIKLYCDGAQYDAVLRGKLLKEKLYSSPIAVGDDVKFTVGRDGKAIIEEILPRAQQLSRPDLLVKNKIQVIASNLDRLVIITSTKEPQFKPGLVDRLLISAELEKLGAIVVINKVDIADINEYQFYADAWESLGYKTIFTSAKTGYGITDLIALLENKSSVFAGHSGVGKSSILNVIKPSLQLATKEISSYSGRGVHTTTSVNMFPIGHDGWVVDTPGIKVFGLTGITRNNLCHNFPEMDKLHGECKFNDCLHINEPSCAVKNALKSGEIYEFRYKSYKKIWEQLKDRR